jgi:hypothetical protein
MGVDCRAWKMTWGSPELIVLPGLVIFDFVNEPGV